MKTSNAAIDLLTGEGRRETAKTSGVKAVLNGALGIIGAISGVLIVTFPLSLPVFYVIVLFFL